VLVITPEATSLTDAYGLLKILSLNGFKGPAMVVVNQSKDARTANIAYTKLKKTVQQYLSIKIVPLGLILHDDHVAEALQEQKPFISLYPQCNASKCIQNITKRLLEKQAGDIETHGLETFWTSFLSFSKSPVKSARGGTNDKLQEPAHRGHGPQDIQTEQPAGNTPPTAHTGRAVSCRAQDDVPETSHLFHMVEENHLLLSRLAASMSSVSKDLRAIREALGNGNRAHPEAEPLPERDGTTPVTNKSVADPQQRSWIDSHRRIEPVNDEKRRGTRFELVFPVRISGFEGEKRITDISPGGVFIECANASKCGFQTGQILHLFMKLPTRDTPLVVKAQVRHVGERGIGCKFVEPGERNEEAIRQCISVFKDTLPIAGNTTDPASAHPSPPKVSLERG